MEINGYEIIREINRGPITTVYLARQVALDRSVLLKVLNVQWKNERDLIARFRREAKICARLHHPNIVTVYDFGTGAEQFYISMEFVEGHTLADFIRDFRPLPITVIFYLIHEILKGLDYAHRHGVIHRDIKPSNIMISTNGAVKISDFGMATIAGLPGVTEQGDAVGSPAYISPEQALGKKITANTDLFSLGATIYEMVSGFSPFKGDNIAESIHKTLSEEPLPLNTVYKEIPEWFALMVGGMLQKEAKERVADCGPLLIRMEQTEHIDGDGFASFMQSPHELKAPVVPDMEKKAPVVQKKWLFGLTGVLLLSGLFFIFNRTNTDVVVFPLTPGDSLQALPQRTNTGTTLREIPIQKQAESKEKDIGQKTVRKKRPVAEVITGKTEKLVPEKNAGMFIICSPWADIYLNGKKVETTPLNKALSLPSGRHLLELKNPNYRTFSRQVELSAAQTETLRVRLLPQNGTLDLRVHPWAKIYIDDVYYETTPLEKPISLSAGLHVLRLENPGFISIIDSIEISAGKTLQKRLHFAE